MATVQDYAVLSTYVYSDAGKPPLPAGWGPVLKADGSPLERSDPSGYYGAVFRNTLTGEVAVVSRGTTPTDGGDLAAGGAFLLGQVPYGQLGSAEALLRDVLGLGIPEESISFTGHSLGGALSQMLAAIHNLPAVTFNAVPVKRALAAYGLDPNGDYPITDIVDASDPIAHAGPSVGQRVTLPASPLPCPLSLLPVPPDPSVSGSADTAGLVRYFWTAHTIDGVSAKVRGATTVPGPCPVILDLDGDGVETTAVAAGPYFDHDGDGFAEKTGWVGTDDGLVVRDLDGNGAIDSGGELFGNHARLADGSEAPDGFAALAALDGNADGVLDAADAAFASLRIWRDADGDGLSAQGELRTLTEAGVRSIATARTDSTLVDAQGNAHRLLGTFTRSDGSQGAAADVWFQADRTRTLATEWVAVPASIAALPDATGYGTVRDLRQAMARDGSGTLQGLVAQFAAATDPAGRDPVLDPILFAWTGSAGLDPQSRGGLMDARRIAVLEQFTGEPYVGLGGPNPTPGAAVMLTEAYRDLREMVAAELLMQTHAKDLFSLITYEWDEAAQATRADLDEATAAIEARLATDAEEGTIALADLARTIRGFQAEEMTGYWDLRDRFASRDAGLGWAMDAAGRGVIEGTASADTLTGTADADALRGGDGADSLSGDSGADVLHGEAGADLLAGGDGDDLLAGGADDDEATGGNGNDRLYGEAGADRLHGEAGADVLQGGAGDDRLWGGDGDDRLDGGPGNDTLDGGYGNDTYLFGRGSGQDAVEDHDWQTPNSDRIVVAPDVAPAEVTVTRDGGDLVLRIQGTGDEARLRGWFDEGFGADYQVQRIEFSADGTVWDVATLKEVVLQGTPGADLLLGYGGAETIDGREGDDLIYGRAGNDTLAGGAGADRLYGEAGDDALSGGDGEDRLEGGEGNDTLAGGAGNDVMDGGLGDDTYLFGRGSGQDTINDGDWQVVDADRILVAADVTPAEVTVSRSETNLLITITGTADQATVPYWFQDGHPSYQELARVEFLSDGTIWDVATLRQKVLQGTAGPDTLVGSESADTLSGLGGADSLWGYGSDDRLDGGSGADAMWGGQGNDTYIVDDPGDVVVEAASQGLDSVQSSVSYALPAEVEQLTLTGTGAVNGTGNALANTLTGNAAANTLDGGAGADTMTGGTGNDTYVVDNAGDRVTELSGQGTDTVMSAVSYTLGANLENLALTGTAAINATGNSGKNVLTGNASANVLNGGSGADTMAGGAGNDTYVVDNSGDVVTEAADAGIDTVQTALAYTLGANVENLTLTGSKAVSGTGNALANTLTGNTAANALAGGAGADVLIGGRGSDTYRFDRGTGADRIVENDTTKGNTDTAAFGGGIVPLDLILSRGVDSLVVSLQNSADSVTVQDWYRGAAYKVEVIQAGDGSRLLAGQVDSLIQAMAAFTLSTGLTWSQAVEQRPDDVAAVLAAHWQPPQGG